MGQKLKVRRGSLRIVAVLGIGVLLMGCGDDERKAPDEQTLVCAGYGGDSDADDVCQARDNCPDDANPDQGDLDGDGIGNACDGTPTPCSATGDDDDIDGVCDSLDNCPDVANPQQGDHDADGMGDACDDEPLPPVPQFPASCTGLGGDEDEDDWCASHDNCPEEPNSDQADGDADGLGDACDDDDTPPPEPTLPDSCSGLGGDEDEDEWCAAHDNCPDEPNTDQADSDADALGDACDEETCDGIDNDGDGELDNGFEDTDADEVADCIDVCPVETNVDADADGLTDCIDPCLGDAGNDEDEDGFCYLADNCPEVPNDDQEDRDDDGIGDDCDLEVCDGLDNDGDNIADEGMSDADDDDVCDEIDDCPSDLLNDSDRDGLCSDADNCSAVANAGQGDADNDGVGDACDLDSDGACGDSAALADPGTVPLPASLAIQSMAVDPAGEVAYLTIGNTAGGSHANELVAIDIATQSILWSALLVSDPNPIAISADGGLAYVGTDQTNAVRVVDLKRRALCYEFLVGYEDIFGDVVSAGEIAVLPSYPETVVISTRDGDGIYVFDRGVRRPVGADSFSRARIIEVASDTTLYGYNNESTEFGFRELQVDAEGIHEVWVNGSLISGFSTDILYAGGRIYATSGVVLDPSVPRVVGQFADDGLVAVDDELDEAYLAVSDSELRVYSTETFLLLRTAPIDVPGTPLQMLRWADGLIIRYSTGVYVTPTP